MPASSFPQPGAPRTPLRLIRRGRRPRSARRRRMGSRGTPLCRTTRGTSARTRARRRSSECAGEAQPRRRCRRPRRGSSPRGTWRGAAAPVGARPRSGSRAGAEERLRRRATRHHRQLQDEPATIRRRRHRCRHCTLSRSRPQRRRPPSTIQGHPRRHRGEPLLPEPASGARRDHRAQPRASHRAPGVAHDSRPRAFAVRVLRAPALFLRGVRDAWRCAGGVAPSAAVASASVAASRSPGENGNRPPSAAAPGV